MSELPFHGPHPADKRRVPDGPRTAEARARLDEARAAIRHANEHDAHLARLLVAIEQDGSYVDDACSSAKHWAMRQGLDEARANSLLQAGRAFHVAPESETAVLNGDITPQKAGEVGKLVETAPKSKAPADPEQQAADEDAARELVNAFVDHAKVTPRSQLNRDVNAAKERRAQGEPVVPLRFEVKQSTRDKWRLARKIAIRKEERSLTEGEAFEHVTDDYLARHDDTGLSGLKDERPRRMEPTSEHPEQRHRPVIVKREAYRRADGHCEFPGCTNGLHLELCHLRWHKDGGDRELENTVLLCTQHHAMMDKDRIRFFERSSRGVIFLITATGELVEPDPGWHAADILPPRPDEQDVPDEPEVADGHEHAARLEPSPECEPESGEGAARDVAKRVVEPDEQPTEEPTTTRDTAPPDQVAEGAPRWNAQPPPSVRNTGLDPPDERAA